MRIMITVMATFGMLLTLSGPAAADEYRCTGKVGARTLDNVRVPASRTCYLNGTTVKGTLTVGRGAQVFADNSRIIGNVQGEGFRNVTVHDSRIGGSVQVVQGGLVDIRRNRINGDVLFDENTRRNIARRNVVGGNIQAFQNTGGVEILRNVVDANLQCKANRPAPTGGHNRVYGNKEDQCRRL